MTIIKRLLLLLLLLVVAACGDCGSDGDDPPDLPSGLTYLTNSAVYTVGTAIANNTPSNSGGAVTSYSVAPALPTGLSLNTTTGVISGTPSSVAVTATYTVTASNASGETTVTLSITVNAVATATMTLNTTTATMDPSSQRVFMATVTGLENTAVTWSTTPAETGVLTVLNANNVAYTAPASSGQIQLIATSVGDSTVTATVTITVSAAAALTETIFNNGNIGGVSNGGTSPSFTIPVTRHIVYFNTYHYFNGGALPGTLSLRHSDGTVYGPWQTTGVVGQGAVQNAYWVCYPDVDIKPGTYTVIDSDPSTWSQNGESSGMGFAHLMALTINEGLSWGAPALFSDLHQGFQNGRLVIDVNERALLAWTENAHVWSSSSTDGVTWDSPEQVDDATNRASLTALEMNASGQAALVWRAEESTPADYFKARLYEPTTGWEDSVQFLDGLTVDGTGGAVDINDSGDVMAVFARYGSGDHVWARSYDKDSGWDAAATSLDTPPSWSNSPDVALNPNGSATVVWEQWNGARTQAFARSYAAGSGWAASPTALDDSADPSIDKIRISLGADGNGIAHWTLENRTGVKARRLVSGSWQETETVVTGSNIYTSDALIAPDGRIVQTWSDSGNVYARICVNGVWDAAAALVSDDDETVGLRSSVMAMDRSNGRVIVMWTRLALADADGSAVWARRYDPIEGWSPVEQVLPWTPGILYDVDDVALLDDGRAVAVLAGEDVSVWKYSTYLISYR